MFELRRILYTDENFNENRERKRKENREKGKKRKTARSYPDYKYINLKIDPRDYWSIDVIRQTNNNKQQ